MPRPKQKTKAEDLLRVRNNQRKSRERRKQHVAELEQKIRQLEAAVQEPMRLEKENRILRTLLGSVGFDSLSLAGYLQSTPLGGLRGPLEANCIAPAGLVLGVDDTDQLDALAVEPTSGIQNIGFVNPNVLDISTTALANEASLQSQPQALDTELMMTEDLATLDEPSQPGKPVDGETTLCSVAFHLVIQCNRTGKDVFELETRLRTGYKMPAGPGEGCRVDNRTLLAVLAELVGEGTCDSLCI